MKRIQSTKSSPHAPARSSRQSSFPALTSPLWSAPDGLHYHYSLDDPVALAVLHCAVLDDGSASSRRCTMPRHLAKNNLHRRLLVALQRAVTRVNPENISFLKRISE